MQFWRFLFLIFDFLFNFCKHSQESLGIIMVLVCPSQLATTTAKPVLFMLEFFLVIWTLNELTWAVTLVSHQWCMFSKFTVCNIEWAGFDILNSGIFCTWSELWVMCEGNFKGRDKRASGPREVVVSND